jgi:succinate-acetate transporter protein
MSERESITYQERYFGAKVTATVFKVFGALWIVAGVIILARTAKTYDTGVTNSGLSLGIVLAIEAVATILGSAMFAFFGYILDLLRGIWEEVAGEID